MKKIVLFLTNAILVMSLCNPLFAYDSVMEGQKQIRISQTKYFDIIFPEKSAQSAQILFEKADEFYEELKTKLNLQNDFRLPVVISPAQDEFNAYQSCAPFNHIVVFDTPPAAKNSFFDQELLNTFRHELIHAVTFNLRSRFLYNFNRIFGDTWNPALLTTTLAMAEGATVSMESDAGQGRMNSGFHLNLVRQAKIQGKFPKYSEIQGAMDTYPSAGASYYFGGAFSWYLQKTYGMEKYAQFWYRCVNLKSLTYFGAFKKVYGISIKKAWQDFYESIEVPPVQADPAEEEFSIPLNVKSNKKKSLFMCLAGNGKKIIYYDQNDSTIRQSIGPEYKNDRKLLTIPGITSLSLSQDGRYLGITQMKQQYHPTSVSSIYDLKQKKTFTLKQKNLREICIFNNGNTTYAAAIKTFSQYSTLCIYSLEMRKGKIKKAHPVLTKQFSFGQGIFSPCGTTDGNLFFILKQGPAYSIVNLEMQTGNYKEYPMPQGIILQGLSVVNEQFADNAARLSFCYATKNQGPRIGSLSTGQKPEIGLSKVDVAGGVFSTAYAGNKKFAYIGEFFNGKQIFLLDSSKIKSQSLSVAPKTLSEKYENEDACTENLSVIKNSHNFNLPLYMIKKQGTLVPLGLLNTYEVNSSVDTFNTRILPLGLTYVTSTPWTMPIIALSGGYNYTTNSAAFGTFVYGGSYQTDFFNYSCLADVEFDSQGFKQTYGKLDFSNNIPLTALFSLNLSEDFQLLYGRQSNLQEKGIFEILSSPLDMNFLTIKNKASVSVGNIHHSGKGHFDYSGFAFGAFYNQKFLRKITEPAWTARNFQNIGLALNIKSSFLRPSTFQTEIFPTESYIAAAYANLMLFDAEIQKSTNFLPLFYFNRLKMNISYLAKFANENKTPLNSWAIAQLPEHFTNIKDGKFEYFDQVTLTASLYATPNIGGLARPSFQFSLNAELNYRFYAEPDQKQLAFGIYTNFGTLKL